MKPALVASLVATLIALAGLQAPIWSLWMSIPYAEPVEQLGPFADVLDWHAPVVRENWRFHARNAAIGTLLFFFSTAIGYSVYGWMVAIQKVGRKNDPN